MDIKITPANLRGKIEAVSSKSYAHRLFLAAALSDNPTEIYMKNGSADLTVTLEVLKNLGLKTSVNNGVYRVTPIDRLYLPEKLSVDVRDSLATLRFLLPVINALTEQVTYDGDGKLLMRSYADLLYVLKGVGFTSEKLPFTIKGRLTAGEYRIPKQVGMQLVSGLMFALPLLERDSKIIFMESVNTINADMTAKVLSWFGVAIEKTDYGYFIKGNQSYCSPVNASVEGDYALSCVWKLAQRLGADVTIDNLNGDTLQPEKKNFDIIDQLFDGDGNLSGVDLEMLPVLSVGSVFIKRKTVIKLAGKPSDKELMKVNALILALNKLGAHVEGTGDGVVIDGDGCLTGDAMVDSFGDFRLTMALSLAGCFTKTPIKILGAQTVLKHYPSFFNELNSLGSKAQVE